MKRAGRNTGRDIGMRTGRRTAGRRSRQAAFLRTVITSVCLVMITAFCISGTVMSREQRTEEAESEYYRELGSIYAEEMRDFLKGQGYADSGVTVTSVEEEGGARSYTVTIHHGRIDRLTQEEKEELLTECSMVTFPDRACNVYHKFLEKDC